MERIPERPSLQTNKQIVPTIFCTKRSHVFLEEIWIGNFRPILFKRKIIKIRFIAPQLSLNEFHFQCIFLCLIFFLYYDEKVILETLTYILKLILFIQVFIVIRYDFVPDKFWPENTQTQVLGLFFVKFSSLGFFLFFWFLNGLNIQCKSCE